MILSRRHALGAAAAAALARPALVRAQQGAPIRIGEISSYAARPGFSEPYRKGWEMALAHVNDLGGLNGAKVEFVSRDDGGDPARAVQIAGELLHDQGVALLAGGTSSATGLALSQYALQNKVLYVAGEPLTDQLVWSQGNRYTYHVRPSAFMLAAMLIEAVIGTKARTWVSVAPDNDDGRVVEAWFRKLLTAKVPGTSFADPVWAPSPFDAKSVLDKVSQTSSDAVFSAITGADLVALVRQAGNNPVFGTRTVAALAAGDPEYLTPLGSAAPAGWFVTGYPWDRSDEPFNKQFVLDYTQRYREPPTMGSVVGSALVSAIVSGILKSGSTDPEAMATGFANAGFVTPFGICTFRAIDHQSTLGSYIGRIAVEANQGVMTDWHYIPGAAVMPPDADIKQLRPT